ncbi:MAG: polysaccharide pyruvyl transferase family protein [Paludibacter sp.]|nr:polysaccharide pyruvyl transferase family protein [Paludibacter sp.]
MDKIKNILIINQPCNNRGDEAAHRSLIRALSKLFPDTEITILFAGANKESVQEMIVNNKNIKYHIINLHRGFTRLVRFLMSIKCEWILYYFHPNVREYKKYVASSDYVINAPGGICMGQFQNWQHILWLNIALNLKKNIAYYGRSFGPFPDKTIYNKVFRNKSLKLLRSFDFITIRDKKTMEIADKYEIPYTETIDTAFLDVPNSTIPESINKLINSKEYIVFVPNSLTWHPGYMKINQKLIDSFYIAIFKILNDKFPNSKIVLLPQLFNCNNSDERYFEHLKNELKSSHDNIVLIPEIYSSDIQQAIIKESKLVVGARYHSIVFAINNNVPFIALSYEHKIEGLLDILHLDNWLIDITEMKNSQYNESKIISNFQFILDKISIQTTEFGKETAYKIAHNCLKELQVILKNER